MMKANTAIAVLALFLCSAIAAGVVAAVAYGFNSPTSGTTPPLAPFVFHRQGAASPEAAAITLFRGVATESPSHFVQHLLLGVCDGPIDTLQKFAEGMHETEFKHGNDSFTFYDLCELRKEISPMKPIRVIAMEPFDTEDKQVAALEHQMISTYYGEAFMAVDVAAESYDGLEYHSRIVVAQLKGDWYAIPRCRSAKSFYEIADAMTLGATEPKSAK